MKKLLIILAIFGLLIVSNQQAAADEFGAPVKAHTGNLYQVSVSNQIEAGILSSSGVKPVLKLRNSYLLITYPETAATLENLGLKVNLITSNISKDEMAADNRKDRANVEKFELIFEEDKLRVFRVDFDQLETGLDKPQLSRMPSRSPKIEYKKPVRIENLADKSIMDLQTLIGMIDQDSLQSYLETLQAFYRRNAGSTGNYASRDWIASKFASFGYDSIWIDSFTTPTQCQNVHAYKIGTMLPEHYVIVGAHRDGVWNSPAADDNGSGTVAVLEIARILKDIDTDLTFIFSLYDSEEEGLLGSYHYADAAAARGDSIIHMFNMDMIGNHTNTNQIDIYYGSDLTHPQLLADLADSLLGVESFFAGSISASDHHAFLQNGYSALLLIEKEFSTVYHTPQDSTTYVSFPYLTLCAKSAVATSYFISQTYRQPSVAFAYPEGTPIMLTPNEETTFHVAVTGLYDGIPVHGSGDLHYSINGGPYTTVSMTEETSHYYEAVIPAFDCDSIITYYFSANEIENGTFYDPDPSTPYRAVSATDHIIAIDDDFQTDQSWTTEVVGASSGQWQRGVPVDDDGWDYDPATDGDGSGMCYLTQNQTGNTDVDGGSVRLISPVIDMSNGGDIEYDYFLNLTDDDGTDKLLVEINNNGGVGTWSVITNHNTNGALNWRHHTISEAEILAAGVTFTSNMKVRFTANDGDPQSIVEAGVDGFNVSAFECLIPLEITGMQIFEDTLTVVLVEDVTVTGSFEATTGETTNVYDIWLTDPSKSLFQPSSGTYDFVINIDDPGVVSYTETNDWQFSLTGGAEGQTSLTIDIVHSETTDYTTPSIDVTVNPPILCGDATDDDLVNVSDAVFIINYVFVGGAAPDPLEKGDVNCDGEVNVSDAVHIVNYIFVYGFIPCDTNGDEIPDC
jgi:Peptidase family M28/Dockerin type I domain